MAGKNKTLSGDVIKSTLARMLYIRKVEETLAAAYLAREVGGFCHLCIGQEAIYGALSLVMQRKSKGHKYDDDAITGYRAHGFMFINSADMDESAGKIFAELMGKAGGCSKGKGGSMHIFDIANGFYGGHGIVGAQVSLGTGMAFAHKYKQDGGVTFIFMGDGAFNQGQVYESFNMASLWNLPAVYIIENNGYAMGTSVLRGCAGGELFERSKAFGIDSVQVDAMNMVDTYEVLSKTTDLCRKESRPLLIEMLTYRFKGHSMSDPGTYRTRVEVDEYRKNRDPIDKLKNYIFEHNIASNEEIKIMERDIASRVDAVADKCRVMIEPDLSELYTDVYASK